MPANQRTSPDTGQPTLFALEPAHAPAKQTREPQRRTLVVVGEEHLPEYPPELVDLVHRALGELPANRVWFTYRDIKECFGISRATVARRLKSRLVPGIRIVDGRVQEDGAVRRFDRRQLKWLLLSVRHQDVESRLSH